jgi:hypothetical protein
MKKVQIVVRVDILSATTLPANLKTRLLYGYVPYGHPL